ncbi:ankyrin repeat domain-containing protein, partial [bacterium]|nr:ankyrin repeat domain-containing protein [bacterium]
LESRLPDPALLRPVGPDRFEEAATGRVYSFYRDETGKAARLVRHGVPTDARRMAGDAIQTIRIEAQVDGRDRLVFRGGALHWQHIGWGVPGRQGKMNLPTKVNGVPWMPGWPDLNGPTNHWTCVRSTPFLALAPPLPQEPLDVGITVLTGRGTVRVIDAPSQMNDYTLTLEVHDHQGGADAYAIDITATSFGPPAGPQPDPPIPTKGLVFHLPLDGNANDATAGARHGEVHGAALAQDRFGRRDRAYDFDGQSWIQAPAPPRQHNAPLSVSVWVRYDQLGRIWHGVPVAQDMRGGRSWLLATIGDRLVWHRMLLAPDLGRSDPITTQVWYHVVATFDGARHTLYRDGVLLDHCLDSLRAANDTPITIGRKNPLQALHGMFLKGQADDVRIYDRPLTHAEVRALYRENGFERFPLAEAAERGKKAEVERLLVALAAEGGNLDQRDKFGRTALYRAATAGHADMVKLLLAQGAEPNALPLSKVPALHATLARGHEAAALALIQGNAAVAAPTMARRTPLHEAASIGSIPCVTLLLKRGAPVGPGDNLGNTPLHRAAAYGRDAVCRLLIGAKASANALDKKGKKPAQIALEHQHANTAKLLEANARAQANKRGADF